MLCHIFLLQLNKLSFNFNEHIIVNLYFLHVYLSTMFKVLFASLYLTQTGQDFF